MNQVDKNNDFELSLDEFMDEKAQSIYKEWMASQVAPGQSTTDKGSDTAMDSEVSQAFTQSDTDGDKKISTYEM